nr:magnesium transporter MRS2-3-like [Ipomoea batatas]
MRKKASGVRPWLLLDCTGQAQVVEAGKHAIMRRTGLPGRDLRILDPLLSYPSTVLGRERAIVINLEHIKAIITAQEETGIGGNNVDWGNLYAIEDSQSQRVSRPNYEEGKGDAKQQVEDNRDGIKLLPFEFVALEACLEATCTCLDSEARTLEQEAHPALDKLTSKISTLNLERVRQIKSRLVAITGRVQKVRDELEHLLDDDEDMAEMYLSDKLFEVESSSVSSMNEQEDGMDDEVMQSDVNDRIPAEISIEGNGADPEIDYPMERVNTLGRDSHATRTSTTRSAISKHLNVEELEMLLEAYFIQIDGTLNKLSTLREYVDDTEDYINIMLDDKQNHLLQMGVMLTAATLVISAFVAVAGVFGMNITIELFNADIAGMPEFLWTIGGGSAGCIILYVAVIAWCKHKRLLD